MELSPNITLRDLIVPPPSYRDYASAAAHYAILGRIIASNIAKPALSEKAPKSKAILQAITGSNMDGFDQLDHLYRSRFPFLGALGFDAYALIKELQVKEQMLIVEFISQAHDVQAQLQLSGVATEMNALIKHVFALLMRTNLQPLIALKNHSLQEYMRNNGNSKEYTGETISSLCQFILGGNPPEHLVLTSASLPSSTSITKEHDVNDPSAYSAGLAKHNSSSSFSRPTYATMIPQQHVSIHEHDDATVLDDIQALNPTKEEQAIVKDMVKPLFALLQNALLSEADIQALYKDFYFSAMSKLRQHRPQPRTRQQCGACLGNHATDECRARGPNS